MNIGKCGNVDVTDVEYLLMVPFKLSEPVRKDIRLWFKILLGISGVISFLAAWILCLIFSPIWVSVIIGILILTTCGFMISKDLNDS